MTKSLVAPVTYQGGKSRIASQIVDKFDLNKHRFYDLCCGSGAITIELLSRGIKPSQITMVDKGPWGLLWQAVGEGRFNLNRFIYFVDRLPKKLEDYKSHMEILSSGFVDEDAPYIFLLLQAAAFGGKAIWIEDRRWQNCTFRSYWKPTTTSNRQSPVNPMMPMPQTIIERLRVLIPKMSGIYARCLDISNIQPELGSLVYIDPPYTGTTGYGHSFDIMSTVRRLRNDCWVSESYPLSQEAFCLSKGRAKGGISGDRSKQAAEYLSLIRRQVRPVKKL